MDILPKSQTFPWNNFASVFTEVFHRKKKIPFSDQLYIAIIIALSLSTIEYRCGYASDESSSHIGSDSAKSLNMCLRALLDWNLTLFLYQCFGFGVSPDIHQRKREENLAPWIFGESLHYRGQKNTVKKLNEFTFLQGVCCRRLDALRFFQLCSFACLAVGGIRTQCSSFFVLS